MDDALILVMLKNIDFQESHGMHLFGNNFIKKNVYDNINPI